MKYVLLVFIISSYAYSGIFDCLLSIAKPFTKNTSKTLTSSSYLANSRISKLANKYDQKKISFLEATDELMEYLPRDLQEKYRKVILKVEAAHDSQLPFDKIKLNSLNTSPSKKSIPVTWSSRRVSSPDDMNVILNKTINILTESQFNPISEISSLRKARKALFQDNIQTITDNVMMKLLVNTDTGIKFSQGSKTKEIFHIAKTLALSSFSKKYRNIKGLKITSKHVNIFENEGAIALYKYISKTESESIALKYYLSLFNNIQIASVAVLTPIIAPKIYNAYIYHKNKEMIKVKNPENIPTVNKLIEHYDQDPEELLADISNNLKNLDVPEDERDQFQELLDALHNEQENGIEQ